MDAGGREPVESNRLRYPSRRIWTNARNASTYRVEELIRDFQRSTQHGHMTKLFEGGLCVR